MERVKQGEKYWYIDGTIMDYAEGLEQDRYIDEERHRCGNYFRSKEECMAMASKLRAVLKGADVIEGGCIVIHTERCPDAQTEEIADAIADFLTEKFPDYAKTILN